MTFCSLKIDDFFIYAFKIFLLSLVYGFFNPFLSLLKFFSYDSLLKLFHFLRSCLLLNISYIIHGVFVFLLTFLTKSLAVSQTDLWIFSTIIAHFYLHFRLSSFSSVFEHITSPYPILDFPLGTV
jgi:hypothetical protein